MIIKESLFRLRKFSTLTFVKTQVTTGIEIKIYRNFTQGLLNGICKIKLGEFIMYRKIISLVLSFTILFIESYPSFAQGVNIPNNYVENSDGTSSYENEEYSDYCENYPKNKFGQISDVDCAVMIKIKQFRANKEPSTELSQVGPNGETDVYLWKYVGLSQVTKAFNDLLVNSYKDRNKNKFIEEFISQTNNFFNISSIESAAIAKKWVEKSKYSKVAGFTQKDIENWTKDLLKELIINREKVNILC